MKKMLVLGTVVLICSPLVAQAAWWNPFTWGKGGAGEHVPSSLVATSSVSASTSTSTTYAVPSTDDLYKRIAELEDKLADAQAKLSKAISTPTQTSANTSSATSASAPASSGLTEAQIVAKVKPASVRVSTATSTAAGTIIDSKGDILTNATAVIAKTTAGVTVGAFDTVTVTLSDGTKKQAQVIGLDESNDVAIVRVTGSSLPYVSLTYDTGLVKDSPAYIFSYPVYESGTLSRTGSPIEVLTSTKPLEIGGAVVNAKGGMIGIPQKPTCKLLEEMTKCVQYSTTVHIARDRMTKLIAGMRLYTSRKGSSSIELLIRGQFEGMYGRASQSATLSYAISSASGSNSFDYFNSKLSQDIDGKITKIYLTKLKTTADYIYNAVDFLKTEAYNLNIFFINNSADLDSLGTYQRAIVSQIQSDNAARLKEYQAQVDLWSKKKNEYDGYITNPSAINHDYLLEQGVYVESAADYVAAQRNKVLGTFSGENVAIF